jgi:hypothetical protein
LFENELLWGLANKQQSWLRESLDTLSQCLSGRFKQEKIVDRESVLHCPTGTVVTIPTLLSKDQIPFFYGCGRKIAASL